MEELVRLAADLSDLITRAIELNREAQPTRSRELSLTITKLEEGNHWLRDALNQQ